MCPIISNFLYHLTRLSEEHWSTNIFLECSLISMSVHQPGVTTEFKYHISFIISWKWVKSFVTKSRQRIEVISSIPILQNFLLQTVNTYAIFLDSIFSLLHLGQNSNKCFLDNSDNPVLIFSSECSKVYPCIQTNTTSLLNSLDEESLWCLWLCHRRCLTLCWD